MTSSSVQIPPQRRRRRDSTGSAKFRPHQRKAAAAGGTSTELDREPRHDDAACNHTSRAKRSKLLPAAIMLAASGALLMLSSGSGGGGSSTSNVSNLRFSRKLAAVTRQLATGTGKHISPAIAATVQRLAEPFLADEANIFAFDETDPRPVVNTFFAIRDGRSISKEDAETLAVWKQAWSGSGWNPRILSIHHAEAHPEYAEIVAKIDNEIPLGPDPVYDRSCYLRHFAMAVSGGGWMTDYDTIPLNMNADVYGKEFPNEGQFTSYEVQVPSLIVGNSEEWDRVSRALLQEGVNAKDNEDVGYVKEGQPRLFSDMYAFGALVEKDEVIAEHAVSQAHTWLAKMEWDLDIMADRGTSLQQNCQHPTQHVMALHFSHVATNQSGYLPDPGRPIFIAAFLDRWSKLCGGPDFHFGDDAGIEDSPSNTDDASSNAISDALYDTDGTMAISRENSFLYVQVPRTGGPALEQSSLFNDALSRHPIGGLRPIDIIMKDAEEREITNFVKAAHIRHPCDRFVDAFDYLSSSSSNAGDKELKNTFIGNKSIDDFVLELEQKPEISNIVAHFAPMSSFLFHPDGTYGIDVSLCHETWDQGLNKLSNDFNLPVPRELYSSEEATNQHRTCADLRPETREAIERIYQLDYCVFGYDSLPQSSCPQHDLPQEHFTERYSVCSAANDGLDSGPTPQDVISNPPEAGDQGRYLSSYLRYNPSPNTCEKHYNFEKDQWLVPDEPVPVPPDSKFARNNNFDAMVDYNGLNVLFVGDSVGENMAMFFANAHRNAGMKDVNYQDKKIFAKAVNLAGEPQSKISINEVPKERGGGYVAFARVLHLWNDDEIDETNEDFTKWQPQMFKNFQREYGDVDVLIYRTPLPWMQFMKGEVVENDYYRILDTAQRMVNPRTVIFTTSPVNNNAFKDEFVSLREDNNALRQFMIHYKPPPSTAAGGGIQNVMLMEWERLTDELILANAETMNIPPEMAFKHRVTCEGLSKKHSVTGQYYCPHLTALACAGVSSPNHPDAIRSCVDERRGRLSLDGMHWCESTTGPRTAGAVACLIQCATTADATFAKGRGGQEQRMVYLKDCQDQCNALWTSMDSVYVDEGDNRGHLELPAASASPL